MLACFIYGEGKLVDIANQTGLIKLDSIKTVKFTSQRDFTGWEHVGDFYCYGGGLQSTVLLYMIIKGILPKPIAIVHANTGDERGETNWFIDYYINWLLKKHGIPFIRLAGQSSLSGDLIHAQYKTERGLPRLGSMPVYVKNPDGTRGRLRRQCTDYVKIHPTQLGMKAMMLYHGWARPQKNTSIAYAQASEDLEAFGFSGWEEPTMKGNPRIVINGKRYVRVAFGITTDEAYRCTERGLRWQTAWYPLVEMGMSRDDCEQWCRDHGFPVPPKSACIQCPYRSNESWLMLYEQHQAYMDKLKANSFLQQNITDWDQQGWDAPTDFAKACKIDRALRDPEVLAYHPFYGQIKGEMYLHESLKPLWEIDFKALIATKRQKDPLKMALMGESLETCGGDGAFSCFS